MSSENARMPPLDRLTPVALSRANPIWMGASRLSLMPAGGWVLARIIAFALETS